MPTKHLLIKGKVQGVFYRATAKEVAKKLGITGWIKNSKDGHVEATVSGDEQRVKAFIDWCKKGPPEAEVENVAVTDKEDMVFDRFVILR